MPLYRSIVNLPAFTGAPEDAATNTLYFVTPDGTTDAVSVTAINARLNTFYGAIGGIFSKVLVSPGTVKHYAMADPTPRIPVGTGSVSWTASPTGQNLPEEVAMCLSFKAANVSGANEARRRGRIFLGPLNVNCTAQSTGAAWTIWQSSTRTLVANAAAAMANPATNLATWVQYSETDGQFHFIAGGWIDQQPDTQRRRGHRLAGRTLWTTP